MYALDDTGSGAVTQPLRQLGKYELIARVAEGGMAEVYLARQRGPMNFQKIVIVKVIHPHLASQEEFLRMLLDEARVSALIKHPRVVDIYELGCADGIYFIAMEYLAGQPMGKVMAAGLAGARLDPWSTARIIADAAEGLDAAHNLKSMSGKELNVVHRDVSPGNIMVLYDGSVKIVDFGIAKARGRLANSGVQQFKGKLGYVAPEQLLGKPIDRRADVFGLGVVLWEALALERLYPPERERGTLESILEEVPPPPSSCKPDIPPELDAVCARALAGDPDERYQTAGEMKQAIELALHSAGYFRESDTIRLHMEMVFRKQREKRDRLLRRAAVSTAEFEIPQSFNVDAGDYAEVQIAEGTDPSSEEERAEQASHTASVPRRPRARGWLVALGLLVAAAGGASAFGLVPGTGDSESDPPPARHEAPAAAKAPDPEPAAVPAVADRAAEPSESAEAEASEPQAAEPENSDRPEQPERSAEDLVREGGELFIRGKLGPAKDRFKQALRADPRHAPAHRGLGLVYQKLGKSRKAIRSFERYLELRPNAGDADSIRDRIQQLQQ